MKSFNEAIAEADKPGEPDSKTKSAMRNFVYHAVLKTDKPHDEIKKSFVKKFGSQHIKHFEKHVSAIVD